MTNRNQKDLIDEINENFTKFVSSDAKSTILTIRNLIESNARVEESIDELHKSIAKSNVENDKLQKRIYWLTVVAVIFTLVQVFAAIKDFLR